MIKKCFGGRKGWLNADKNGQKEEGGGGTTQIWQPSHCLVEGGK